MVPADLSADGPFRDGRIICIAKDTKQALPASNRLDVLILLPRRIALQRGRPLSLCLHRIGHIVTCSFLFSM